MAHAPAEHHHEQTNTGLSNRKLAFWLFLSSECMFFAALIGTYLGVKDRATTGPFPGEIFDIKLTSVSTFVLLFSSLAMVLAVQGAQQKNVKAMRTWLAVTILGGLVFLGFQAFEFTTFVNEGLTITSSIFGSAFFVLTGFHGTHVLVGVIWLISLLVASYKPGALSDDPALDVEIGGLYWHFVDVVWIVIFTVVYLIEVAGK